MISRGRHSTVPLCWGLVFAPPDLAVTGLIPGVHNFFSQSKIVDVAKVYQRCCCLEQWSVDDNIYRTHLVLYGGKTVLQKVYKFITVRIKIFK